MLPISQVSCVAHPARFYHFVSRDESIVIVEYIPYPRNIINPTQNSGQCISIPQHRAFVTDVESARGVQRAHCISCNMDLLLTGSRYSGKIYMQSHCRRISVCDRGLQVLHSNVSTGNTFPLLTYLPAPSGSESL